ncbi:RNA exonuclease 3 [Diatrype stigma]|uniref:RNA exonuclease 3 n=1 Tax=Diatrype stigma TaxID=117547 RepID=A0AAN9URW6_9PEZI
MRLKLVKALHDQYRRLNNGLKKDPNNKEPKLVLSEQELIVRILDEEQDTAIKKASVYGNSMKNQIMRYKKMTVVQWREERARDFQEAKKDNAKETPDPSQPIVTGLTIPQEVELVKRLVWPLEDLQQYGYITSIPSEEEICKAREAVAMSETPPNPNVPADRAISFDCEMGYTVYGIELIRLTAVSWPNGEELIDVLVQPVGETLDLNTRYSGVRPEDMVNAERWKPGDDFKPTIIPSSDASQPPKRKLKLVPSPKAARDLLFSLMSPETPLIGHGIENDLNSVRIIHPTVIDTVLLYPHKRGLPIRHALKALVEMHLGRKIQLDVADENGVPEGHDSAEDARAAGDLVKLKVREEWRKLQLKGWKLSESGEFVSPGEDGWTIVGDKKGGRS